MKEDYILNNHYELSAKSASGNNGYLDKIYLNDNKGNIIDSDTSDTLLPQTIRKSTLKRLFLPNRTREDYILNNQDEQSVKNASDNSDYLYKTHFNNDRGNILHSATSATLTSQTVSTEVPHKTIQNNEMPPKLKGSTAFTIYHQNIRGLGGKVNELISQLYPTLPHILCFSEHHMKHPQLQKTGIDNYRLADSYCRNRYEMGGVCIYVREGLNYTKLHLEKYCQDKDFEVCAIKTRLNETSICIIAVYRAPTGKFDLFISKLDTVIRKLYTATTNYIICGDINVDYLVDSGSKNRLDVLLKTYNLASIVKFPTRIQENTATTIDNFFIDTLKMSNYSISPVLNGLSDHDAQLLKLLSYNIKLPLHKFILIRQITDHTVNDFLTKLSCESWEPVFSTDDVNVMFNSFLDTYLKLYYASFPLKRKYTNKMYNNWITSGIKTSCRHKRELFMAYRNNKNPHLLRHYKSYCKILSVVIREAKKNHIRRKN